MPRRKPVNPFNFVLLITGMLFVVTSCGYSVMAVKGAQTRSVGQETESGRWLLELLDEHGFTALMAELSILAVATFAAIATDGFWERRGAAKLQAAGEPSPDPQASLSETRAQRSHASPPRPF